MLSHYICKVQKVIWALLILCMMTTLQFGQLNCRGSAGSLELLHVPNVPPVNVWLLQDPPLALYKKHTWNGYNVWHPLEEMDAEHAIVLSSTEVPIKQTYNWTSDRICGVIIKTEARNVLEVSVYLKPRSTLRDIQQLGQYIETTIEEGLDVIIGADGNGHHNVWGASQEGNNQGRMLYHMITELGICVHNDPQAAPTFRTSQEVGYWLDITFSNWDHLVTSWSVYEHDIGLSDHNIILYKVTLDIDLLGRGS